MSCDNLGNNQVLISACACQKAANSFANLYTTYENNLANYATAQANYLTAYKDYQTKHDDWAAKKSTQETSLQNEDVYAGCGGAGTSPNCPGGYDWNRTNQHCGFLSGGWENICRRSHDQVIKDLQPWIVKNPEPNPPSGGTDGVYAQCGSPCNPPSGNNIQCCTQYVGNITAGKSVTAELAQNCSQEAGNKIAEAGGSVPVLHTTTPSPEITTNTSSNIYLIIGLVFFLIILVGIIIMLSQQ